jgi:hypothetical protein
MILTFVPFEAENSTCPKDNGANPLNLRGIISFVYSSSPHFLLLLCTPLIMQFDTFRMNHTAGLYLYPSDEADSNTQPPLI